MTVQHQSCLELKKDTGEEFVSSVVQEKYERRILIRGRGLGMAIVANKVRGTRAAPVMISILSKGPEKVTMLKFLPWGPR